MNDTTATDGAPAPDAPDGAPTDDGFEAQRLRTIADMRRSSDDRIIAGVCAGAARYLNVDPIVLRILLVVLTFVGLAGPILYLAAWFFLPADDEPQSVAADWFNLDQNEPQVRTVGLFAAGVLAVAAVIGDTSWGLWWVAWWVIPVGFLFWLFVVRPRRRREEGELRYAAPVAPTDPQTAKEHIDAYTAAEVKRALDKRAAKRNRPRPSGALTGMTISLTAVALAVTLIVDRARELDLDWTTYVAVALGVIAVGCLIGTFVGHATPLYAFGSLLVVALALGSSIPRGPVGDHRYAPESVAEVDSTYEHGIGRLELDLTNISGFTELVGRTIRIDAGVGETVVIVPDDLAVKVNAHVGAGDLQVFDRQTGGHRVDLSVSDTNGQSAGLPVLTIDIDQNLGSVKVIHS